MSRRAFIAGSGALAALLLGRAEASPQPYPSRPIRLIVGYLPGAQSDLIARLAAPRLGSLLGGSVVVENRGGANGTIGLDLVARSAPDGYTLGLAGGGSLTLAPMLDSNVRYDPLHDFLPLARLARVPLVLVSRPDLPVKTMPQLLEYARRNPGKLTYASTGASAQLAIELLQARAAAEIVTVAYKGTAAAVLDVLAGRVDLLLADVAIAAPHVASGGLQLIACAGSTRARMFPNLPTMAEQGLSGVVVESWQGIVAPAGLAGEVAAALRGAMRQLSAAPDFRDELERLGFEPIDETPEALAAVLREELARARAIAGKLRSRVSQ